MNVCESVEKVAEQKKKINNKVRRFNDGPFHTFTEIIKNRKTYFDKIFKKSENKLQFQLVEQTDIHPEIKTQLLPDRKSVV